MECGWCNRSPDMRSPELPRPRWRYKILFELATFHHPLVLVCAAFRADSQPVIAAEGDTLSISPQKLELTGRLAKEVDIPYVQAHFVLDDIATRDHILSRLDMLERSARIGPGYAVAFANPYPVTIEVLQEWGKMLEKKNIRLVPAKLLVKRDILH